MIALEKQKIEKSKTKALNKKIIIRMSKEKLQGKANKKISLDDKERDRFMQTISKIKSRNASLTQKTDLLPQWQKFMNFKEKGFAQKAKKTSIPKEYLPPQIPGNTRKRLKLRSNTSMSIVFPESTKNKSISRMRLIPCSNTSLHKKVRTATPSPFMGEPISKLLGKHRTTSSIKRPSKRGSKVKSSLSHNREDKVIKKRKNNLHRYSLNFKLQTGPAS